MRGFLAVVTSLLALEGVNASKKGIKTIKKDVAIIGGGGSGAYSAVRLREDFGVSIVLVEKEDILVCHFYLPPSTGAVLMQPLGGPRQQLGRPSNWKSVRCRRAELHRLARGHSLLQPLQHQHRAQCSAFQSADIRRFHVGHQIDQLRATPCSR